MKKSGCATFYFEIEEESEEKIEDVFEEMVNEIESLHGDWGIYFRDLENVETEE